MYVYLSATTLLLFATASVQARRVQGFMPALIALIQHQGANADVKMCAAVALKNAVKRYWDNEDVSRSSPFTEEDKSTVRTNLVPAVLSSTLHAVTNLTIESIALIAMYDFPDRWNTGLIQQLNEALNSSELKTVFLGARIVRRLAKLYAYRTSARGDRGPWEAIVQATFPRLAAIFKQCLGANTLDAANMMRIILKAYWSAISYNLEGFLAQPDVVLLWVDMVHTLLGKPLPEASEGGEPAGQPTDPHERYSWPWWKCKKWCACILDRFMNRYGAPHFVPQDNPSYAAAEFFHNNLMARLVPTVVGTVALRKNGRFCTDRVYVHCLSFIKICLEFGACWKQLSAAKDFLLQDVILATLKFNAEDITLWKEDSDEFIRTYYGALDDPFNPRVEVKNLLFYLTKARGKAFMPYLLQSFNSFLTSYNAAPADKRDWTVKDAVLAALGSMSGKLMGNKSYRGSVPEMLAAHVIPELQSPLGPMRARAVSVVGEYVNAKFDAGSWRAVVLRVIELMQDSEAVVQYVASATFSKLLRNVTTRDVIEPLVDRVLETLLQLVARFKTDDVVSSLAAVFTSFPEKCADKAPALCGQLSNFFQEFSVAAANSEEGEGDHLEFAAINCLQALVAVIDKTPYTPARWEGLIASAGQLAAKLLDPDSDFVHWDFMQTAFDIVYNLAYGVPVGTPLPPALWQLFERVVRIVLTVGCDFSDVFATTVDPFLCKDVDTMLNGTASTGEKYVQLMWSVHLHMVEKMAEDDQVYTSRTIVSLAVRATNGRLDALLPQLLEHFVSLGIGASAKAKTDDLRVASCSTLSALLLNNNSAVVAWLDAQGVLLPVLTEMVATQSKCLSALDKKLVALGLLQVAQVLPAGSAVLPEIVCAAGLLAYQFKHNITGVGDEDDEEEGGSDSDDEGGAAAGAGGQYMDPEGAEEGDDDGPVLLGEVDLADDADIDRGEEAKIQALLAGMVDEDGGIGMWDEEEPELAPENSGTAPIDALDVNALLFSTAQLPSVQAVLETALAGQAQVAQSRFQEVYQAGASTAH